MDSKGGINWAVILAVPIGLILLVALLPVIDILLGSGFDTLDSLSNTFYISQIQLLLGSLGLILGLGVVWFVIRNLDTRTADFGPPSNF